MAILAIKGHSTRSKEVLELLKMIGGKNFKYFTCDYPNKFYYVLDGYIQWNYIGPEEINKYVIFTLEEFLEKYPYKVGDKVKNARINDFIGRITNVRWDNNEKQIIYVVEWDDVTKSTLTHFSRDLQPYKEQETMEIKPNQIKDKNAFVDISSNEYNNVDTIELLCADKFDIEIIHEDKIVLKRKKPKYPTTYKKCCEVLKIESVLELNRQVIVGWNIRLLSNLQQLLICRNAYWKIAGDWEPDYKNKEQTKYVIANVGNNIAFERYGEYNAILAFPTEEMRDAFYENFKDLIETCKELYRII